MPSALDLQSMASPQSESDRGSLVINLNDVPIFDHLKKQVNELTNLRIQLENQLQSTQQMLSQTKNEA